MPSVTLLTLPVQAKERDAVKSEAKASSVKDFSVAGGTIIRDTVTGLSLVKVQVLWFTYIDMGFFLHTAGVVKFHG